MSVVSSAMIFERLYGEHGAWLRHWLARQTRCSHRAADLAQDVFCRLLESGLAVAPRDPRAYITTVARRLLIDDIRRRDVERAVIHAIGADDHVNLLTPERIAEAVQLLEAIAKIIEMLPDQTRTTFLLRRIERMEQKDIAVRLGISLSTVKRHIALAYARCHAIAYAD